MSEFRLDRNATAHYSSFAEAAKSYGCKPVSKVTKDMKKLKEHQEKFCERHLCSSCGQPMTWVEGTSTMVCSNAKCRGIKQTRTDKEGNEIVSYLPSYDLLDSKGSEIAYNIFSQTNHN